MTEVAGVDAAKGGWVAVRLVDGAVAEVLAAPAFAAVVARCGAAAVVGVDMPIGLPALGRPPRAADLAARAFLGNRRSSVFEAPPAEVLAAPTHAEATALAVARSGRGISRQAYGLGVRIREVAEAAAHEPRIVEVHPEVSFAVLAGLDGGVPSSKKSWNGVALRRRLLEEAGIVVPDDAGEAGTAAPDDLLDAAAVAWSAARYARGEARPFPGGAAPGDRPVIWG